jgi:hypothetical protein
LVAGLAICQQAGANNPIQYLDGTRTERVWPPSGPLMDIPTGGLKAKHMTKMRVVFNQSPKGGPWPTHLVYKTFTNPRSGAVVPFMDFKHYQVGSVGKCWEYFVNADGNKDWILWANTGTSNAPVWTTLSDDALGLWPLARVWIQGSVGDIPTILRLSAWDSGSIVPGGYVVMDLGAVSQATCEDTPYAVLRLINSTVSIKPGP